jgi:DNA-binding MarR family transcriptional regulator
MSRIQGKSSTASATSSARAATLTLPLAIPHAVTRVFREQNRLHGRAVQPFGLSTEQAHLLLVLWTYGPLSMTELGREVALSSGTLSAAIDRMEAAGLVRRVADPDDGRALTIEPARWSASKRDKLTTALLETESTLLTPLSTKERATLLDLLTRILEGLAPPRSPRRRPRA